MAASKILIAGGSGLLGPYLVQEMRGSGNVATVSLSRGDLICDLTSRPQTRELVASCRPHIVINAVGCPFPDACEGDPAMAYAVNRDVVANLVSAMDGTGFFVQISTDHLYPDVIGPHAEKSVGPVNVYAASKLAGEVAALKHPNPLVLRANFFGPSRSPHRKSFSDFFIDALRARKRIKGFSDIEFSPLHLETLARVLGQLVSERITGVYNLGSRHGMTKAAFILAGADRLGLDRSLVEVVESDAFSFKARRPRDMRMDVSRIESVLGTPLPDTLSEIGKLCPGSG
jgi:dTDP-4-dehydrorhamnose reductase